MFITNSPAPSRINSAGWPQRDVTVWEFAIFGYFPCIIRTVRTRSFNHKHKHRKMAIFCYFFSRFFFCSSNWESSYSNWEKNILFGIGNTTEYRSSKRAKKNPGHAQDQSDLGPFCMDMHRISLIWDHFAWTCTGSV